MRLLGALLACAGVLAGCVQDITGSLLCQDPAAICDCQDDSGRGGVVVRWRITDASVGQLLDRGQCCCNPSHTGGLFAQQCSRTGSDCLDSPAWLVRHVQLHIKSVTLTDAMAPAVDCTITTSCQDGELTTPYCLVEGTYDLQLTADIDVASDAAGQFACSNSRTLSPPAVRRTVKAGQAVNLDGIVLGVNAPPISVADGGVFDGGTTD